MIVGEMTAVSFVLLKEVNSFLLELNEIVFIILIRRIRR